MAISVWRVKCEGWRGETKPMPSLNVVGTISAEHFTFLTSTLLPPHENFSCTCQPLSSAQHGEQIALVFLFHEENVLKGTPQAVLLEGFSLSDALLVTGDGVILPP